MSGTDAMDWPAWSLALSPSSTASALPRSMSATRTAHDVDGARGRAAAIHLRRADRHVVVAVAVGVAGPRHAEGVVAGVDALELGRRTLDRENEPVAGPRMR